MTRSWDSAEDEFRDFLERTERQAGGKHPEIARAAMALGWEAGSKTQYLGVPAVRGGARPEGIRPADRQDRGVGWISPAAWHGKIPPRREWMVDLCFMRGTVGMLSGDGGIGKSVLALQLCCAAALRRRWIGLGVTPGRALYLGCEDDTDEFWRRTHDIAQYFGSDVADLGEGLLICPRVGQSSALIDFERFTRVPSPSGLYEEVKAKALEFGASYIVIDTATKTFPGNQNDEIQVDAYITILRKLAIVIQGVVIVTKHPSLSGRAMGTGESGNVAWNNSVRARLYFVETKDGRELRTVKSNYGPGRDSIKLRWEKGVFVRDDPPRHYWQETDP